MSEGEIVRLSELLPIGPSEVGGEPVNTVNARDLHESLGVGKDFSDWIKQQVDRAKLKEDTHFIRISGLLPQKGEQVEGGIRSLGGAGLNRIDYFLTIDAAKHIAMMANTDKGSEVRDYFIECERRAKNPALSLTRSDLARMILESEAEKAALEAEMEALASKVEVMTPKAEGFQRIADADGLHGVREAAKILGYAERKFVGYLMSHEWAYRNTPGGSLLGYAGRVKSLDVDHKVSTVRQSDGSDRTCVQMVFTPKGLSRLTTDMRKDIGPPITGTFFPLDEFIGPPQPPAS